MTTNMKFRVRDEEHSKEIQEALFKEGYTWYPGSMRVQYTDEPFLYASSKYNDVTRDNSSTYFKNSGAKEMFVVNGQIVDKEPLCILHGVPVYEDTVLETRYTSARDKWHGNLSIMNPDPDLDETPLISHLRQGPDTWEKFYRVKPTQEAATQGKKISLDQLIQNVVDDNPGATEIVEVPAEKTDQELPTGLMPARYFQANRIRDILGAMMRYVNVGAEVPEDWLLELIDLLEAGNYVAE